MTDKSATPLTDDEAFLLDDGIGEAVMSYVSRHLETELAIAKAEIVALKDATKTAMVMRLRNQFDEQVKRAEKAEEALRGYVMSMESGNPDLVEHADKQARAALKESK